MTDQAEGLRQLSGAGRAPRRAVHAGPSGSRSRCLAVTSAKGGVGKTNLAVNLGLALAARGLRVGVLDADLGLANVDLVLGMTPPYDIGHVLYGQKTLEEILLEGPNGLKVLAGGAGLYELANLSRWRLERLVRSLSQLDELLDILLIDTGAGISRNVLSFVLEVEEVLVVTTPEPPSIADAYSMIKVITLEGRRSRVHLVVNMARDEREAHAVYRKLEALSNQFLQTSLRYLGFVPRDEAVGWAVRQQVPVLLSYPSSRASQAIGRLAAVLEGGLEVRQASGQPQGVAALVARVARLWR